MVDRPAGRTIQQNPYGKPMIEIDGSLGEGGGQVLRTALSLSCITGRPFRIVNIRKGREKTGLMRQHLVSVQAAARIAGAKVIGDTIGSTELIFSPGKVTPGEYAFAIGTAGATSLVLQTLILPLLFAVGQSSLALSGGTHVPFSPSWHYLAEVFVPSLALLGGSIELDLDSCGFYPKGGGNVRCRIKPAVSLSPLHAEQRGRLLRVTGCSAVGNLPCSIAERQRRAALEHLGTLKEYGVPLEIEIREVTAIGQGTFIFLRGEYEHSVSGFTAIGARGKPAEIVGGEAADEFLRHHETGMPVDPHLADQLVPYLALAGGTSVYATSRITGHLETNLRITCYFLDIGTKLSGKRDSPGTVRIMPAAVRR
jgi:RNA 3'-terminal phosphate cyclase (ATP)